MLYLLLRIDFETIANHAASKDKKVEPSQFPCHSNFNLPQLPLPIFGDDPNYGENFGIALMQLFTIKKSVIQKYTI